MLRTLHSFAPPLFIVCVVCNKCMHVLQTESWKYPKYSKYFDLVNMAIAKIWNMYPCQLARQSHRVCYRASMLEMWPHSLAIILVCLLELAFWSQNCHYNYTRRSWLVRSSLNSGPVHLWWDILPLQKKVPLIKWEKNIWWKLMVFFPIRSIYLNGTNYHKLLLHYGENLWGKLMGKIYGEN